jgi:hypothetical protein
MSDSHWVRGNIWGLASDPKSITRAKCDML